MHRYVYTKQFSSESPSTTCHYPELYAKGYEAAKEGKTLDDNPLKRGTLAQAKAWADGFRSYNESDDIKQFSNYRLAVGKDAWESRKKGYKSDWLPDKDDAKCSYSDGYVYSHNKGILDEVRRRFNSDIAKIQVENDGAWIDLDKVPPKKVSNTKKYEVYGTDPKTKERIKIGGPWSADIANSQSGAFSKKGYLNIELREVK